ncbi:unnamed protein product [Adineta steineri]|uniref:Uncharacterized protein n=1 Tax=Adineta steineri TaxID=433720 RepID=A0A814EIR5_9BILA|nr:unnamed protein product [Adineta steineri]CAF0969667.1 unnamed protein product [Adineta steineri]CAF1037022.1 unnamed protein product [Adineta steineri]
MSRFQRDQSYKLLVVGDKRVGKTDFSSVIGNIYPGESTIKFSIGYNVREVEIKLDGEWIQLTIYDSSGAICRDDIIKYFDGYVHGIFIIYDATNRESFQNLNKWLDEINNHRYEDVRKLIIGNRCGLAGETEVSFNEAREYGIQSNISMFEVSPQNRTNVELVFQRMILKIQSGSTSTINRHLGQYREQIHLEFVDYIFDVDLEFVGIVDVNSDYAQQHVNDQDFHENTENENDQSSTITEETSDMTVIQNVVDQGPHNDTESEHEQVAIETDDNAGVRHTANEDDGTLKLARLSLPEIQIIEEKAKQSNLIRHSNLNSI